jgi:hypothetical protein
MPEELTHTTERMPLPSTGKYWEYHYSIVRFNPQEGESIYLNYSQGIEGGYDFQHGPGIDRDGEGPPSMRCIENPWEITTDIDEQRIGTWPYNQQGKKRIMKVVDDRIKSLEQAQRQKRRKRSKSDSDYLEEKKLKDIELRKWQGYRRIIENTPTHHDWFHEKYPDLEIIGEQGCGDLTMNPWYVAFINSGLTGNRPRLIHLHGEPMEKRSYTCLVKWSDSNKIEIITLKFNPFLTDKYQVMHKDEPVADKIEFAIYGKPIIRAGRLLDMRETCHQYSDIRHLFLLPDLNLSKSGFFYGRQHSGAIYFGEAQLLNDRNLRRAALSGPIELNRLYRGMGASIDEVRDALKNLNYRERKEPIGMLRQGEWRFTREDDRLVDIYLRRSQYGCTMIGVDQGGGILCCAYNSRAWDQVGDTIPDAARRFRRIAIQAGFEAKDVLIFDEGADVFQRVKFEKEDLKDTVPPVPGRTQIRAMFIFAK